MSESLQATLDELKIEAGVRHVLDAHGESHEAVFAQLGLIIASVQAGNGADGETDIEALTGLFAGDESLSLAIINLADYYYNRHFSHAKKGDEDASLAAMRKAIATWERLATTMPDSRHTGQAADAN